MLILGVSLMMPEFSNSSLIEELKQRRLNHAIDYQDYKLEYLSYTTIKYELQNISIGCLILFSIGFLFLTFTKAQSFDGLLQVRTIKKTVLYYVLLNLGIALILIGFAEALFNEEYQYPIYDNGVQALFGIITLSGPLFISMNLLFSIFILQRKSRTTFFNIQFKTIWNYINGLLILFISLIFIVSLTLFIYAGAIAGVASSTLLTYLCFSLISELNQKDEPTNS